MNILILTPVFPYPPDDGDRLRIYNFIKQLKNKNNIYLISFLKKGEEKFIKDMQKYCKKILFVLIDKKEILFNIFIALFNGKPMNVFAYRKKEMEITIKNFLKENKIDVIFAYRIRMAQYVENVNLPKIVDFVDSLGFYMDERIKYEKNILNLFYLFLDRKRVLLYEKKLTEKFDYVLINYEEEKDFLKKENILVVPNGVDISKKIKKSKTKSKIKKIGFFGDLNYAPNRDGILFFYKKIWKKLNKFDKNLKLIIAGKNSIKIKIKSKNVEIKGYIRDLNKEIKNWDLCIVPVRYGAGRQNKILKSWANNVPVIATSFAAKGVYGKDGYNLLIADKEEDFIEKIKEILNNKTLQNKLNLNAKKTLKKYFDWRKTGKILKEILWRLR